jgi:OmpA family
MKKIKSVLGEPKRSFFSMVVVLLLAPVLLLSGNAFAEGHSGPSHEGGFNHGVGEHGYGHGNYGDVHVQFTVSPNTCTRASSDDTVPSTCLLNVVGGVTGVYGWGHPLGSVSLTVTDTDTGISTAPQDCGLARPANTRPDGDSRDNSSIFSCQIDARNFAVGNYTVVATYNANPNRSDDDDKDDYFNGSSYSQPFTVSPGAGANPSPSVLGGGPAIANITATPVIPTLPGGTTGSAKVTWTVLSSPGITGFTVTSDPGGFTCNADGATATSCVIPGLSTDVHYTFKVVAHTASGNVNLGVSNSIMINALLAVTVHNNLKLIVSNFAPGSAQLTAYMKMQIATYASDLLKFGAKTASLVGYTDPSSTTSYNLTLGMKRAAAVQAYLIQEFTLLKMPWTPVVTCASKGKAAPRATNTSAIGRALNRRVEVLATF